MSKKKLCRLCLGSFYLGYSLLDDNNSFMLETLTSIKVSKNDGFSYDVCFKCLLNLKLAFNIQQSIINSNYKLINSISIKSEIDETTGEPTKNFQVNMEKIEIIDANVAENISISDNKCLICRKKVKEDLLIIHINDHFNQSQKCNLCGEQCENVKEYQNHIEITHKINEKYHCGDCNLNFKYCSLYKIHEESHLDRDSDLPCDTRERMYKLGIRSKSAKQALITSQLLPDDVEEGIFTCHTCNKRFTNRRQFLSHSHDKGKCPICHSYISKSNLRKHIANHSSGPQICELCGATLKSLESLRGHLSHTHSTKDFTCDECGQKFKKRYPFILHKKKHSGEKTHVCESCGKAFLTFYNLNKHIKMAHLKLRPYICEYCSKAFSSRFALRTHVRQHTNETPYKCEFCAEGFRQNVSLRAHRRTKHNIIEPKNCECKVCGKKFASEQAIVSHMRLH